MDIYQHRTTDIGYKVYDAGDFGGFTWRFLPLSIVDALPIFVVEITCRQSANRDSDMDKSLEFGKDIVAKRLDNNQYVHKECYGYWWSNDEYEIGNKDCVAAEIRQISFTKYPPTSPADKQ